MASTRPTPLRTSTTAFESGRLMRGATSADEGMDDFEWDGDPLAAVPEQFREAEVVALGSPTDKSPSDGYQEMKLLREHVSAIDWEPVVSTPPGISRGALTAEQWSLVEALYELRLLTGGQIQREFLTAIGERHLRRELSRLRVAGVLRRGLLYGGRGTGRGKPIYALADQGFALLRDAPDHSASGEWRRPVLRSAQHAVHDLVRNEWLFAFRSLAPRQLLRFLGSRSGKIKVPKVRDPRAAERPLAVADLGARAPSGLVSREFSNIVPDLTLELQLERPGKEEMKTDLLVEIESGNNNETIRRKARAYDGLLNGWWQEHPRYKALGRPPTVVFAVPDLRRARRYITIFDKALQGYWVIPPHTQTRAENEQGIVPTARKVYDGRRNVFVAVARDVHQRSLRAWQVPERPPEERMRDARGSDEEREVARAIPRRVQLFASRDLVDPASEVGLPSPGG